MQKTADMNVLVEKKTSNQKIESVSTAQIRVTLQKHGRALLWLICPMVILFLPVILFPHWGTFDDSLLILQSGRRLVDHPESISNLLAAGPRSGLFIWVALLWQLFPEIRLVSSLRIVFYSAVLSSCLTPPAID